MWWTNERTDNDTHKPQWQPHFSKMIWPQYPNPRPKYSWTDGWTHEMATIPSASMSADDKTSGYISKPNFMPFSKWFFSETARLNRCYKTVEIKWSMSYPCLMIPIMSSSIRFELKMISALQWRYNGRDCVSNNQPPDCLPNRLFRRRS